MDIEARLETARTASTTTRQDLDAFYLEATAALKDDPQRLNGFINLLKAVCLEKAFDHSKYKLREMPQPQIAGEEATATASSVIEGGRSRRRTSPSTYPVKKILEACRSEAAFLGYALMRYRSVEGLPEKFAVVGSQSVSDEWIGRTFQPDFYAESSQFQSTSLSNSNSWVLLFLFHCMDAGALTGLQKFVDGHSQLEFFDLEDYEANEAEEQCWKANKGKVFNGTVPRKPSVLVHDALDSEQECLIKEFFGSNAGFLVCSELKGGLSGARAILVAPKAGPGDPRKYVVKVCRKAESKLKDELARFKNFVEPYWVPAQFMMAEFKETPRYEALRYPFASVDTMRDSISLGQKYRDSPGVEVLETVVRNIFEHQLVKKWRERAQVTRMPLVTAFSPLLDVPKSKEALRKVLSPLFSSGSIIDQGRLDAILATELDFLRCPNHGDLHSNNIRVQAETHAVFLIDFGMTEMYPAGLDYATLEASIKFKLLDPSVDLRLLSPLDSDPLDKFDNLIRSGESIVGDVDKANKLCSMIRQQFLNDFSGKGRSIAELKTQYLCCLLALCLRQVQFPDINRRYVLQLMSQIIAPLHVRCCGAAAEGLQA